MTPADSLREVVDWERAPARLWSLWDMMFEIRMGELVAAFSNMTAFVNAAKTEAVVTAESRKIYQEACDGLERSFQGLDLKASSRALSRIVGNLENNDDFTFEDFKRFGDDVLLRLRDELELTTFLSIHAQKIGFYTQEIPPFGDGVATKFPAAYLDIQEAGKCLALGRSTACVFHLMRTMEVGTRAVANGLGIPDPTKPAERNWGFVLGKVKDAIAARKKWKKGEKAFYEEAHACLDAIRNPWRNATMHVEKTYTPEEAEHIFYAVRFFMSKIASRIDEKGKAIPAKEQSV